MLLGDTIQTDSSRFIDIISLHPNEMQLIRSIRYNWRFGEVTVLVRDGIPYRMKRVTEFIDLST